MKLAFVSNFLNHHQLPLCERLRQLCDEFYFIATEIDGSQGYQTAINTNFVISYNSGTQKKVQEIILAADAVIFGACPNELIALRMKENKLSFLYSERFYKKGIWRRWIPRTARSVRERVAQYNDKKIYVLCASGYLPYDLSLHGFSIDKCLKWGYFPECISETTGTAEKTNNSILWAGRMLSWKRPEIPILTAERLKKNGVSFVMNIAGDGAKFDKLRTMIEKKHLQDCVHLLGSQNHQDLMRLMESHSIYMFTSDFREGWGAVLNEAMGNGCAVVASHAIGSVPFLVKNRENGMLFKNGDIDGAYRAVCYLIEYPDEVKRFGTNAKNTIIEKWNYKTAAERLVQTIHCLINKGELNTFENGPCSKPAVLKNNWFKG